jgi:hypothetical protein
LKRVLLTTLPLGDPDDVEIYAGAAIWDWMQKPEFKRLAAYNIASENMFWTKGPMLSYSVTVDVWTEVDDETAVLLKLSGLSVNA